MAYPVRTIAESLVEDEQELKALELEAMQFHTRGKNVRDCKQFGNRTCKDRACVSCAERKSVVRAAKVKQTLRVRFRNAHFVTLALNSRGLLDLAPTLVWLGQAIRDWRRRAPVQKVVRGAVGQMEPKLSNRGLVWSTHAHLILDTHEPDVDFDVLRQGWLSCTSGRGSLLVPAGGSRIGSVEDAARYCTKRQDWCLDPGFMPPARHRHLLLAIKGRRLFIQWGTGLPAREVDRA